MMAASLLAFRSNLTDAEIERPEPSVPIVWETRRRG